MVLPFFSGLVLVGLLTTIAPVLRAHWGWGVPLYVGAFVLLAGLALVPTYALALLGGWTFGFAVGFPAALVGYMGGAWLGYELGRRTAGTRVIELLQEHPKWDAVFHALLTGRPVHVVTLIALVRLPPTFPFAPLNLLLAAARVTPRHYLLGSFLGMAPRTVVTVYLASRASRLDLATVHDRWFLLGALLATALVVAILAHISNRALKQMTRPPSL